MSDSEWEVVTQYLKDNQEIMYVQVAMLTIMTLNVIGTFTGEVERVWRAKQSAVTIIFYIIRYSPLLWIGFTLWSHASYNVRISEEGCRIIWRIDFGMNIVISSLSESLVLMRVWALYDFSRRVVAFFVAMWLASLSLQVWALVHLSGTLALVPQFLGSVSTPGCHLTHDIDIGIPGQVAFAYVSVTTLIVFVFMLNRCWARNSFDRPFLGSWRDLLGIRTAFPVVHVLMRDGCAYFLILSCNSLCLQILVGCANRSVISYALIFGPAVYSIPATRMVLNLRRHAESGDHNGGVIAADIALRQHSDVQFARRSSFDAGVSYMRSYGDHA